MAQKFATLWESRNDIIEEFFRMTRDAEENRDQETGAVIKIQAAWRGYVVRTQVATWTTNAVEIQRVYRGHVGRMVASALLRDRNLSWQKAFFDSLSTVIQKRFRGYYSRKFKHNYYARKAYIAVVMQKSNELRQTLDVQLLAQVEERKVQQETEARQRVQSLAERLHHLVSTKSCSGIYNSPYHSGYLPTAFSIPVEEHLRHSIKPRLREEMAARQEAMENIKTLTLSDKQKLGLVHPIGPGSVQAASAYDAVLDAQRQEAKFSKAERVANDDFVSTVKDHPSMNVESVHHGPSQQTKTYTADDKQNWVSDQPFYSAVPTDRLVSED